MNPPITPSSFLITYTTFFTSDIDRFSITLMANCCKPQLPQLNWLNTKNEKQRNKIKEKEKEQ